MPDHELRAIYDGHMPAEHFLQSYINGSQPRGAFWYHVEINKAERDFSEAGNRFRSRPPGC